MLLTWSDKMQHVDESGCIVTQIRGEEPPDLPEELGGETELQMLDRLELREQAKESFGLIEPSPPYLYILS